MAAQSQPGIARLTIETYAVRVVTLGLMMVSAILQARLLGPEGKGLLAAALSWSALIGGIALIGTDSAVAYFVARSTRYTLWFMRSGLIYTLGFALIALALLGWQVEMSVNRQLAFSVALLTPMAVSAALVNAICVGLNRIRLINVLNAASALCYVLSLLALYVVNVDRFEPVVAAVLGVQAATLIVFSTAILRSADAGYAAPDLSALTRYALQSFRGNLAGLLFLRGSLVILSSVSPAAQAGIYSIAVVFADVVLMLPNTLINILLPRLAGRDPEFVAARVALIARYALAGALVLGLLTGIAAFVVVPIGFGGAFREAAIVAFVLCIGAALSTPGAVVSLYFNALEQPGVPATAAWIGCGALFAASLILAPFFGALGAAIAVVVARMTTVLVMTRRFYRATRLNWRTLAFRASDWVNGEQRIASLYEQIVHTRRA